VPGGRVRACNASRVRACAENAAGLLLRRTDVAPPPPAARVCSLRSLHFQKCDQVNRSQWSKFGCQTNHDLVKLGDGTHLMQQYVARERTMPRVP